MRKRNTRNFPFKLQSNYLLCIVQVHLHFQRRIYEVFRIHFSFSWSRASKTLYFAYFTTVSFSAPIHCRMNRKKTFDPILRYVCADSSSSFEARNFVWVRIIKPATEEYIEQNKRKKTRNECEKEKNKKEKELISSFFICSVFFAFFSIHFLLLFL